jgi:ferredoxin
MQRNVFKFFNRLISNKFQYFNNKNTCVFRYYSKLNYFSTQAGDKNLTGEKVKFTFVYLKDKTEVPAEATVGEHILEVAKKYDVDIEGACDASCACSTCHVIFEEEIYNKLPEAKDEEEDLLELAFGLTPTSRLGCQVKIEKEFEGMKIFIPTATVNMHVDKVDKQKKVEEKK